MLSTSLSVTTGLFVSAFAFTNQANLKKKNYSTHEENTYAGNLVRNVDDDLNSLLSRRDTFSFIAAAVAAGGSPSSALAASDEDNSLVLGDLHSRDRRSNKGALIREDYWFMMGKTPPRVLDGPLLADDPEFNAFGSCATTADGKGPNSCTYVSLKQRIPTYSKYGFSIALGAKEYSMLGNALKKGDWNGSVPYLTTLDNQPPPPPVDALLKMVLLASGMLTSPNYSGPSKRLLVARFYANEVGFAIEEIKEAIDERDQKRAIAAWEFGKDSWNSYFQIVNDSISEKVGDKFVPIA